MMLVNWVFAVICISVVFVVWFYVGTANPAVKPGIADEFRFFVWLKSIVFQCFGWDSRNLQLEVFRMKRFVFQEKSSRLWASNCDAARECEPDAVAAQRGQRRFQLKTTLPSDGHRHWTTDRRHLTHAQKLKA